MPKRISKKKSRSSSKSKSTKVKKFTAFTPQDEESTRGFDSIFSKN